MISRGSFHSILFDILIHLDMMTVSAMACTCRMWADFIALEVRRSQAFEERRLEMHFMKKKPEVHVIGTNTERCRVAIKIIVEGMCPASPMTVHCW